MKKSYLITAIVCLCISGGGFYLAETKYPTVSFAIFAILLPLAVGVIALCIYFDKREKIPH